MKLKHALLAAGLALAPLVTASSSPAYVVVAVRPGHYYYHGAYWRYRWNGGYYNYYWNGGYYNYYWHGRYWRGRYRCGPVWCYR
jgi:hypothetical protein